MSRNINVQRYSENVKCATPEGLREMLLADLGEWAAGMGLQRNRVMVATYIRPNVTKGGIIRPQANQDEDRYQGKVGLVLKRGPVAFDYEEVRDYMADVDTADNVGQLTEDDYRFAAEAHHDIPQIGDWVLFKSFEAYEIGVIVDGATTVSVKIVSDDAIISKVTDPSTVW